MIQQKRIVIKCCLIVMFFLLHGCNYLTSNNVLDESNIKGKPTVSNKNKLESLEKKKLEQYFIESIEHNNTKKDNISGVENGEEKKLKSLLCKKKKLVIEYSPLSCGLCVDSLFTYVSKSKLNKGLIIITGSKNRNLIKVELNKYNLNAAILMTEITEETLKQVNTEPRMYLLDSDMIIQHYISIDKSMVKYLKMYIKMIEGKM